MSLLRQSIIDLAPYLVPQDASAIKLNQNESAFDIPGDLKEKIFRRMAQERWNRYPRSDVRSLKKTIAYYTQCSTDMVVCGNGSNELIQAVCATVCTAGDTMTVVSPGFAIYPRVALVQGLDIREVPLDDDFSFDVPALIEAAQHSQLLMCASPNNPTGTVLSLIEIEEIISHVSCMCVIDEAYFEFHKVTAQGLLDKYENLVVVRTCSKALSMAGLRLGYALAQAQVVESIEKARLPFSVGIFQQVCAELLMTERGYTSVAVDEIIHNREGLFFELTQIPGITPIPSKANFILFKVAGKPAFSVYEELHQRGILVRSFNIPRLHSMLRVTVGTSTENSVFAERLRTIMSS